MTHESDGVRVLLIEDNPDDRLFLEKDLRAIKKQKITTECCETIQAGLKVIAAGQADIVFLDLSLPDSWGIDSVRKVHKQDPSVPIVILTGTDDEDLAREAINLGAQDYLVKGQLNPSILWRSITYAIERQRSVALSQWFTALIENSNYAVIGKSLDNRILSFNQGAERIYGYKATEVIGRPIDLLFPPNSLNGTAAVLEQLKTNRDVEYTEIPVRRKDGGDIFVSLSTSPIKNADGIPTASSVFVRDVTQETKLKSTLKEVDERLSMAVKAAKLGLWDWNLQTDVLRWDSGMYQLFDVNEREFTPTLRRLLKMVHPEDRKLVKATLSKKQAFDFDFRTVWRDESVHHIAIKGDAVHSSAEGGQKITGVCFDISERKASERALRTSEQRLRLALDSAKMGVWDYNWASKSISRTALHDEIYGYDTVPPEWNFHDFLSRVVPEDRVLVKDKIRQAQTDGKFKFECRIVHARDNSVRWISTQGELVRSESGAPINMIGTITDITEAKRLEQLAHDAQARREQVLHAIVQHAPIGIVILDAGLQITDANAAFSSMLNVSVDDLLTRPLSAVLPYEDVKIAAATTCNGKPAQIARLEIGTSTLTERKKYWDLSLWPIQEGDDCLLGAVMLVIDCTQTVQLEQQRDDFVASIAHDIKNPLIGASRILEMMCNPAMAASQDRYETFVTVLRESNQNLLSLVQNLVDICRYETLKYPCYFENIVPTELFSVCAQQLHHFAESSGITIKTAVPPSVTSFRGDVIGLRRVLTNLMHNAVKFNKPGGLVEITIDQDDTHTRIFVTDTGEGITDSEKQTLFQRFSQGMAGKRFANGTGLGLYLSKQIVEAHSGNINCESVPGQGTTFVITLPNRTVAA